MLGDTIVDPNAVESKAGTVSGLGFIRATTRLVPYKTMRLVAARTQSGISFQGYEIHMGNTTIEDIVSPFALMENGTPDGVRLPRIIGTYLHGAFENREVLEEVLQRRLDNDVPASREVQYERLADWFAKHANQDLFTAEYLGQ